MKDLSTLSMLLARPSASLKIFLVINAIALLSACATPPPTAPSGFLSDYKRLKPTAFETVSIYRLDGFNPKLFGQVKLAPVYVSESSARLKDLSSELKRELVAHVNHELSTRLLAETRVETKALTVRAALTNIETPNRALNVATTLLIGPLTSGGASLEIEILDTQSGVVQVAATCTERASAFMQLAGAYSILAHTKYAISQCIDRIEQSFRMPAQSAVQPGLPPPPTQQNF